MINGWSNGVTFNEAEEWDNNEHQYAAYQKEIKRLCDLYNDTPRLKRRQDFRPWLDKRLADFLRRHGTRKTANYREIAATFMDNTSPYAIAGKHNEGGLLIELEPAIAKDYGIFFIVSYDAGPDLYSIHYFRKVSDTPQAFDLLYEAEGIYCDMLCELFTEKTGIEIPPVEFGPATITDPDQ